MSDPSRDAIAAMFDCVNLQVEYLRLLTATNAAKRESASAATVTGIRSKATHCDRLHADDPALIQRSMPQVNRILNQLDDYLKRVTQLLEAKDAEIAALRAAQ